MGLDSVELVIVIEDEFQIALSDEEAFKCETPNLLTDLVYSKLRKSESDPCPSMHGFYIVRKILREQFNIARERIRPETKLTDLLSKTNRIVIWDKLIASLSNGQTIYAPLEKPRWIKIAILLSSLIIFALCFFIAESAFLAFFVACFNSIILNVAALSFKTELPKNFLTVQDLTRIIGTLDTKVWKRDQVYNRVKMLVVEQLGVQAEQVLPDSHFIRDLGMD